jgi:hypothetical protein
LFRWLRIWIGGGRPLPEEPAPAPEPAAPLSPWARSARLAGVLLVGLVAVGIAASASWYFLSHRHFDWAVIVVAGDWHAHDGSPSEAFDNARRDVADELADIGFDKKNIRQFSQRPQNYPHVLMGDGQTIGDNLRDLAAHTHGGCLLYFSSHGTPGGLVLGDIVVKPEDVAGLVDDACGDRPTVVIVSACFSGTFVPALKAANRMILTAARADRTSFGCGQDDKYPYFDTCVLAELKDAGSFPRLADRVRDCVSKREAETGMTPPSEPQVSIAPQLAAKLPTWN